MGDMNRVIEGAQPDAGWVKLTSLGAKTPNHLIVPDGVHSIEEIRVTATVLVQTDAKGALLGISLRGTAIPNTPYDFLVGGVTTGTVTTSGARTVHMRPFLKMCGITVMPGQPLEVYGAMITGADMGTVEFQVEVLWSKAHGKKRYSEIRYASCPTLDTDVAMELDAAGDAAVGFDFGADVSRIIGYIPAVGGITIATATGGTMQGKLEGGLVDGDQFITMGGSGQLDTTDGLGGDIFQTEEIRTNLKVTKQGNMAVLAQQGGVDWGTPYAGISVEVE